MSSPELSAGNSGGLLDSAKNLLHTLLLILRTRAELVVTELEEERAWLLAVLLQAVVAVFLLGFGLLFLTLLVVVVFWDTHRLLALGACTAFYLGGGVWAAGKARCLLERKPRLLSASLREIGQDIQGLQSRS